MIGRVYKLTSGNLTYFGSTVSPIDLRFAQHKNNWKKQDMRESQILFDTKQPVTIECLEEIEVSRIRDVKLRKIEQRYIDNYDCVNVTRAYLSKRLARRRKQRRRLTERRPTYIS